MKLYVAEFTIRAPFVVPDDASRSELQLAATAAIDGEIREHDGALYEREADWRSMDNLGVAEFGACLPWDDDGINKPERTVRTIWKQEERG